MRDENSMLKRFVEALTKQLPPEPRSAMLRIQGIERRLLALQSYLRVLARGGPAGLRARWAWTLDQFNSFARSAATGQAMRDEVANVIRYFNAHNPNHSLSRVPLHRPLEAQIDLWNQNDSAWRIGELLTRLAVNELSRTQTVGVTPPYLQPQLPPSACQSVSLPKVPVQQPVYPAVYRRETPPYLQPHQSRPYLQQSVIPPHIDIPIKGTPDQASLDGFKRFLINQRLVENPTNATPGLSRHGQARAVDFVVSGATNLTTGNPGRWRETGFAERLADAVRAEGPNLQGPLRDPDEPWHYNYER